MYLTSLASSWGWPTADAHSPVTNTHWKLQGLSRGPSLRKPEGQVPVCVGPKAAEGCVCPSLQLGSLVVGAGQSGPLQVRWGGERFSLQPRMVNTGRLAYL